MTGGTILYDRRPSARCGLGQPSPHSPGWKPVPQAPTWWPYRALVDPFIASRARAPRALILDVDASDVPWHEDPERAQFHGDYNHYCYLPLYVFCG